MNASRAVLMVVGVNLLAVWAVAAAGGRAAVPVPAQPPHAAAEQAVEEASTSLLAAAERLAAHARRTVPAAMVRDPFRFGADAQTAARHAPGQSNPGPATDEPAPVAPGVEPEPEIVLQGMAETAEGDAVVRTAILRAGSDLVLASLGTRIEGRYDVVALTADSVELEDVVGHVRRTYRLK